jgi:hypothetical protein
VNAADWCQSVDRERLRSQVAKAADCKSAIVGSTPTGASASEPPANGRQQRSSQGVFVCSRARLDVVGKPYRCLRVPTGALLSLLWVGTFRSRLCSAIGARCPLGLRLRAGRLATTDYPLRRASSRVRCIAWFAAIGQAYSTSSCSYWSWSPIQYQKKRVIFENRQSSIACANANRPDSPALLKPQGRMPGGSLPKPISSTRPAFDIRRKPAVRRPEVTRCR